MTRRSLPLTQGFRLTLMETARPLNKLPKVSSSRLVALPQIRQCAASPSSETGDDPLRTSADLADHIAAHESTVRRWITSGDLLAHKFGSRTSYRIRRSDDEAFLRRRSLVGAIALQIRITSPLD